MRIALAFLLLSLPAAAQTALQSTTTVHVRSGPGTSYSIVGQVPQGHLYVGIQKSGNWWKIFYDGGTGWTHAGYYTTPVATGVKVATSALNVRGGPGTTYAILGQVYSGQVYVRVTAGGGWNKIYWKGTTAWVSGSYTTTVALGAVLPAPATLAPKWPDSGHIVGSTCTLKWTAVSGASSYEVRVERHDGAAYQYHSGWTTAATVASFTTTWTHSWYRWSARAAGGSWSAGAEFYVTGAGLAVDMTAPVDGDGTVGENANPDRIANLKARWVRVNFIGDFYDSYDAIVNGFVAKGLKIYMLVGSEAVGDPGDLLRSYPGPDSAAANAWIQGYAAKFVEVVDHFKDRVRVFETYNEPNDWQGGTTHKVHPRWMAKILQELYLNTKHFNGHAGDDAWQVTITSGPLFSFDLTTAADYLADVYWQGRNQEAWDWTKSQTGSFPLDGIGYHLYVAQDPSQRGEIETRIHDHLDAIWNVVSSNEGATSKRIWISELGWPSTSSEDFQSQALRRGLETLLTDARVALATGFCLVDFPGGDWGLFRMDWTAKPARSNFQAILGD